PPATASCPLPPAQLLQYHTLPVHKPSFRPEYQPTQHWQNTALDLLVSAYSPQFPRYLENGLINFGIPAYLWQSDGNLHPINEQLPHIPENPPYGLICGVWCFGNKHSFMF